MFRRLLRLSTQVGFNYQPKQIFPTRVVVVGAVAVAAACYWKEPVALCDRFMDKQLQAHLDKVEEGLNEIKRQSPGY